MLVSIYTAINTHLLYRAVALLASFQKQAETSVGEFNFIHSLPVWTARKSTEMHLCKKKDAPAE